MSDSFNKFNEGGLEIFIKTPEEFLAQKRALCEEGKRLLIVEAGRLTKFPFLMMGVRGEDIPKEYLDLITEEEREKGIAVPKPGIIVLPSDNLQLTGYGDYLIMLPNGLRRFETRWFRKIWEKMEKGKKTRGISTGEISCPYFNLQLEDLGTNSEDYITYFTEAAEAIRRFS